MAEQIQNNPFNRPPRIQDSFKPEEIDIPAPPAKPEDPARNLLLMLLPMGSFLVMGLFYSLTFSMSSGGGIGWLYALPMLGMAFFTFIGSFVMYGEQKHEQKQRFVKQLRDYHQLLDKKESRLLSGQILQRQLLNRRFPLPSQLMERIKKLEINLWERRAEDRDFLAFRLGLGEVTSSVPIKHPDPDNVSPEIRRAYGIYTRYRIIPDAPVTVDLRELGSLALVGSRDKILPMCRSLLLQLAALNSPDDVKLYVFSSEPHYRTWKWLRWLPHTSEENIGGHPTFLAFTRQANTRLITHISKNLDAGQQEIKDKDASSPHLSGPAIIALFDHEIDIRDEQVFHNALKNGPSMQVFSILVCDRLEDVPSNCRAVMKISDDGEFQCSKSGAEGIKLHGFPEGVSLVDAENMSHRLLPIIIRTLGNNSRIPTRRNFLQLYDANEIERLGIEYRWSRLPLKNGVLPFPVRIGNETYARPLTINLAENNHGPHGIIAGTTGSGKSELLQTLISALAMEHHPYFVNFLLIDFKGGSAFGMFENLPHVVGMVSNLDKLSALRALEAIKAENVRRQVFLKEQGVEDINDYHRKLEGLDAVPADWKHLPHLFIVVDEFAQLAHSMPNFLPELVSIGQVGRSLGIHLIMATQRPGGNVTDEMRANLNFRISLRVQTIDDSRDLLRRPDAAFLPHNLPGRAYFQLGDGGTPSQFQVARVGVEYEPEEQSNVSRPVELYKLENEEAIQLESMDMTAVVDEKTDQPGDAAELERQKIPTIASAVSQYLESLYQQFQVAGFSPIDRILLPPLPLKIEATDLLADIGPVWDGKKWPARSAKNTAFNVQVGRRDDLANCNQPLFSFDFLNFGGHIIAVGGPQSGKTNFLKTLVYSLVLKYSPADVHIYALSFAGKELEIIADLPHVGAVIQGNESERLHRLIRFLQLEIEARNEAFSDYRANDLLEYNQQAQDRKPFLVVLIDNFGELKNPQYGDELADIEKLIQNGRACGIHFVLTALQPNDIPYKVANLIQQRIAFNLADHTEYFLLVGRPESLDFDVLPPGRCFASGSTPPMQSQIALAPNKNDWSKLSVKMTTAWEKDGRSNPLRIEILQNRIYLQELLNRDGAHDPIDDFAVGVDGDALNTFQMNWRKHGAHFLIGGPSQSGRTSLLHTFTLSLASIKSPDELWIVLMDGSNGSLRRLAQLPHVISWVNEEEGLASNIANLLTELAYRRSVRADNPDAAFPEILFVMDDYDLTCEALALNDVILTKLGKALRQDTELNFHLLIAGLTDNLTVDPLIRQFKLTRSGISLANTDTLELMGGRASSANRNQELPPGRGYLLNRSGYKLIQFGIPNEPLYDEVLKKWDGCERAVWQREASPEEIEKVREESSPTPDSSYSSGKSWKSGSLIDMDKAVEFYKLQQQRIKKGQ